MTPKSPASKHGMFRFKDWCMADPHDEALADAMHAARYSLKLLTQNQAYKILFAAESYCHLAGHPADDTSILDQLKLVRRAVRVAARTPSPSQGGGET